MVDETLARLHESFNQTEELKKIGGGGGGGFLTRKTGNVSGTRDVAGGDGDLDC